MMVLKKFLMLALLVALLVGLGMWAVNGRVIDLGLRPKPQPVDIKPEGFLMKVGNETLYNSDFDYIVANNFGNTTTKHTMPEADVRKEITRMLVEESATLQAAAKEGLVTLDGTFYNSSAKDIAKRKGVAKDLRKQILDRSSKISFSILSVWYYNVDPPKISETEAQVYAKQLIDKLYSEVMSKKITLEQAGETIKKDFKMSTIDPTYKSNAFIKVLDRPLDQIDSQSLEIIRDLKVGDYSPVVLMKGPTKFKEEYYAIYRLDTKTGEGLYTEWVADAVSAYGTKGQ